MRDPVDAGTGSGDGMVPLDATADADSVRGDTPHWPAAEQEVELSLGASTVTRTIVVEADPSAMDVQLNVDTTSSMRFAIDELQGELRATVIARLRDRVADVAFGVSRFADFPIEPYGLPATEDEGDRAYVLLTPITTELSRVHAAVQQLDRPLGSGGDVPEASAEALYQIATGIGYESGGQTLIDGWTGPAAPGGGRVGGAGFRASALHVVLHVADSPSHEPTDYVAGGLEGTHGIPDAIAALSGLGARVVSIMPTTCETDECRSEHRHYLRTRAELAELALATSAVIAAKSGECETGIDRQALPAYGAVCPLVFDVRDDGSGLSRTLSDAVIALLAEVRFGEVHAEVESDHLQFIQSIRAYPVEQVGGTREPELRDRLPNGAPDGVADSFAQVERGMRLGFEVGLRNIRIAPAAQAQRFRVAVRVMGDGVLLEEQLLRVVVPAAAPGAAPPSAGNAAGDQDPDAGG